MRLLSLHFLVLGQHFLSLMYCHQCDGTDYELLSNKGLKSKISYSEETINCFGPYLYCKSTRKYSEEQCLGITNNCTDNEKCAIFVTNNYIQPHNGGSLSNIWKNPLIKEEWDIYNTSDIFSNYSLEYWEYLRCHKSFLR